MTTVATLLALALAPSTAHAQESPLDRARQEFWEARFNDALEATEEAEQGDQLGREDLISLYELRAQIERGRRNDAGIRAALERLAAIDPDHQFGRAVPPEIVSLFEEVKASAPPPVTVDATAEPDGGGTVVSATASDDPLGLVREVRVHARTPGGDWQTGTPPLAVTGATVEYYAEAIGPGGAPIASAGTADAPLTASVAIAPEVPGPLEQPPMDGENGDTEIPWLWIGAGVGAVALLVIVIALVASSGGDADPPQTLQPTFPMQVEF